MQLSRALPWVLISAGVVVVVAVVLLQRPARLSVDDKASQPTLSSAQSGASGAAGAVAPAASAKADRREIYFLPEAGTPAQQRVDLLSRRQPRVNGTRRLGGGRALTAVADGHYLNPRWSPDGLELLFSKPGHSGLFLKSVNGGTVRMITDMEGVGFGAHFNAEGDIVVPMPSGETQVYKPDGTAVTAATSDPGKGAAGVYSKDDAVFYRPNAGAPAVPISEGNDRYYGGKLSPDGQHIVYNGVSTGLFIRSADGTGQAVSLGEGYSPSWLPDGSGIVYNLSVDDGHDLIASDLYLASADGSVISNLTNTPDVIEVNPSVSPGGGEVAYEVDGVVWISQLF